MATKNPAPLEELSEMAIPYPDKSRHVKDYKETAKGSNTWAHPDGHRFEKDPSTGTLTHFTAGSNKGKKFTAGQDFHPHLMKVHHGFDDQVKKYDAQASRSPGDDMRLRHQMGALDYSFKKGREPDHEEAAVRYKAMHRAVMNGQKRDRASAKAKYMGPRESTTTSATKTLVENIIKGDKQGIGAAVSTLVFGKLTEKKKTIAKSLMERAADTEANVKPFPEHKHRFCMNCDYVYQAGDKCNNCGVDLEPEGDMSEGSGDGGAVSEMYTSDSVHPEVKALLARGYKYAGGKNDSDVLVGPGGKKKRLHLKNGKVRVVSESAGAQWDKDNIHDHPELKKIRDRYEASEGKGSWGTGSHHHSDDARSYNHGQKLEGEYEETKRKILGEKRKQNCWRCGGSGKTHHLETIQNPDPKFSHNQIYTGKKIPVTCPSCNGEGHKMVESVENYEPLDEISKKVMASYIDKAVDDHADLKDLQRTQYSSASAVAKAGGSSDSVDYFDDAGDHVGKKADKRKEGINRAAQKLASEGTAKDALKYVAGAAAKAIFDPKTTVGGMVHKKVDKSRADAKKAKLATEETLNELGDTPKGKKALASYIEFAKGDMVHGNLALARDTDTASKYEDEASKAKEPDAAEHLLGRAKAFSASAAMTAKALANRKKGIANAAKRKLAGGSLKEEYQTPGTPEWLAQKHSDPKATLRRYTHDDGSVRHGYVGRFYASKGENHHPSIDMHDAKTGDSTQIYGTKHMADMHELSSEEKAKHLAQEA